MAQKRPTELQQSELDDLAAELTRRATEPQDPDLLEIPF